MNRGIIGQTSSSDRTPPGVVPLIVQLAVFLLIAVILVVAFVSVVNLPAVFVRLSHLDVGLAALGGIVFLSAYVVRALRWRCFLAPSSVSIPRVIAVYQVAIFVNWLMPVQGGEVVKSLLLARSYSIPISRSLPTIAMDKLMDLLPAVGLLIAIPFLNLQLNQPLELLLVLILVILGVGVAVLTLMAWKRHVALECVNWTIRLLPEVLRCRIAPFVAHFLDALLTLAARPRLLIVGMAYTAVAVLLDGLFCYVAFRAVGADISFPTALVGYTFYNLGYILPNLPGQIGSNEIIGLLVFSGLLHLPRSAVAAMFLFSHPWTAFLMITSGIISLSALGISLRTTLGVARSPSMWTSTGRAHLPESSFNRGEQPAASLSSSD